MNEQFLAERTTPAWLKVLKHRPMEMKYSRRRIVRSLRSSTVAFGDNHAAATYSVAILPLDRGIA